MPPATVIDPVSWAVTRPVTRPLSIVTVPDVAALIAAERLSLKLTWLPPSTFRVSVVELRISAWD
jgi:hypothetical protein